MFSLVIVIAGLGQCYSQSYSAGPPVSVHVTVPSPQVTVQAIPQAPSVLYGSPIVGPVYGSYAAPERSRGRFKLKGRFRSRGGFCGSGGCF